jgi:hypothetical protein
VKRGVAPIDLGSSSEVGALVRLYEIDEPAELATQIVYLRDQWAEYQVEFSEIQLDFDCPSSRLLEYAQFIAELRPQLENLNIDLPISTTGLLTWLEDNPEGAEALGASVEYVAYQLYTNFDPLPNLKNYYPLIENIEYSYKIGISTSHGFDNITYPKNENYYGQLIFLNVI